YMVRSNSLVSGRFLRICRVSFEAAEAGHADVHQLHVRLGFGALRDASTAWEALPTTSLSVPSRLRFYWRVFQWLRSCDVVFSSLASLRESFLESVYDVRDAVFDQDNIEVDEQPQRSVGQLQITEELLFVYGARLSPRT